VAIRATVQGAARELHQLEEILPARGESVLAQLRGELEEARELLEHAGFYLTADADAGSEGAARSSPSRI
jgi:hypothetical protein